MEKKTYLENLFKRFPQNVELYSYNFLPEEFITTSKITIDCKIHGYFIQQASTHYCGGGCLKCSLIKRADNRANTTEEFIEKSVAKFGDKFNYFKTKYIRKDIDLIITCPEHGDFISKPPQHLIYKHGCPKCDYEIPRMISNNIKLENAKKIHNGKYDYSKTVINVSPWTKVEIICPKHGSFWQSLYQHSDRGNSCPNCIKDVYKLTTSDFIAKAKIIHNDKYIYDKVDYKTNAYKVKIICPEHGEFIQRAASHLAGNKCIGCFQKENRLSTEEFINKAKEVHGDNYDYSKVMYYQNKKAVEIICPKHGSFWQLPNTHISSKAGCRFCLESKGERAVESFLKKHGINYIREYRIIPHAYRYDFYLTDFNIYIEFNGIQHYKPIDLFGGIKELEKSKKRDLIKRLLVCKKKGKLITLTYLNLTNDSVESIMIKRLKSIYLGSDIMKTIPSFKNLIDSF